MSSAPSAATALLVEDDALVAMVAEDYLRDLGFEVEGARSGAEALDAVARGGHVVILVDVGLPDMRGDDLARRIRAERPDTPIIMASGYDQNELKAQFEGDALVGVLGKPYAMADLEAALRRVGLGRA